jgi:hypothetical protein
LGQEFVTKLEPDHHQRQERLRAETQNRLEWARLQVGVIQRNGCVRTPIWTHIDGEICGGRTRKYPMANYGISPNEAANTPIQGMAAALGPVYRGVAASEAELLRAVGTVA